MKKLLFVVGLVAFAMTMGMIPESINGLVEVGSVGSILVNVPIWVTMKGEVETFKKLSQKDFDELSDEDAGLYLTAKFEDLEGRMTKLVNEKSEANANEIKELQIEKEEARDEVVKKLKIAIKAQSVVIEELKTAGISSDSLTFKDAMKKAWDDNLTELKALGKGDVREITVAKAEQTYGDINAGLDFAQMKPGITDIPVRRPVFRDLFSTIPLSTEFLKYTEQATVVRDADNIAKCSAVASNTKETLVVNSIETKVIQDEIDFCTMFVADYPFMESRINKLINDSLSLRVDRQLLLGSGLLEETFSINSVSSDFSAAAASCVLTTSIQAANLVDLISGMATQIYELGEQSAYVPNIAIVNNCDWFKDVASLKDLNNNYLDTRVIVQGGKTYIVTLMGLIEVRTSPIVPQNSCYVFDATKGDIVDRQELKLAVSYENKDNFVKHIATLLGYERLNFLVENNNANAFMRCLDVDAAITAITKV